jgi:hypothetical protein
VKSSRGRNIQIYDERNVIVLTGCAIIDETERSELFTRLLTLGDTEQTTL